MKPREIFLSHSSADRKVADRLAPDLRRAGLKVWYRKSHLKGAQQWLDEIGRALERCDWFLLLLTPDAMRSKWVQRELNFALLNDRYNERIVPLRLKPAKLPWAAQSIQMIDAGDGVPQAVTALKKLWLPTRRRRQPHRRKT